MKDHLVTYAVCMIRSQTGLTQQQFAEKYGILIRTLQNWECGHRAPPEYVSNLDRVERIVLLYQLIIPRHSLIK